MTSLIDLDELALRCRDDQAREYIREAVSCYQAGAIRSCIVATWNAVVFDFLHKLRELELTGDNNARQKLENFAEISAGGETKLKEALEFERQVLHVAAEEFELLTPLEKMDLDRLQSDRNRCAHPSMQSPGDPYQPTAELARLHLRNAVEILLEREPVQGKAAFNRICEEIKSQYFPQDIHGAIKHFEGGPLKRARQALIRNLIVGIGKHSLNECLDGPERSRQFAALGAIIHLHRKFSEFALRADFPTILQKVKDERLWATVEFCARIPIGWEVAGDAMRRKMNTFINTAEVSDALAYSLSFAVQIPDLKSSAVSRVGGLDEGKLGHVIRTFPLPEYIPIAIRKFAQAGAFRHAETLGFSLILPLAHIISIDDLRLVLQSVIKNGQIFGANKTEEILITLYLRSKHLDVKSKEIWIEFMTELEKVKQFAGLDPYYEKLKIIESSLANGAFRRHWPVLFSG